MEIANSGRDNSKKGAFGFFGVRNKYGEMEAHAVAINPNQVVRDQVVTEPIHMHTAILNDLREKGVNLANKFIGADIQEWLEEKNKRVDELVESKKY